MRNERTWGARNGWAECQERHRGGGGASQVTLLDVGVTAPGTSGSILEGSTEPLAQARYFIEEETEAKSDEVAHCGV